MKKRKYNKPKKYKPEYNTCSGPSMYPTLKGGDGIKIEKYTSKGHIKVGDIIVYPHPDKPTDVVHRIIKLRKNGVITRGDNNNKVDPYIIKYKDIKGIVTAVKRGNKEMHLVHSYKGYIIHRLMLLRKYSRSYIDFLFVIISKVFIKTKTFNFIDPLIKTKVIYITRNKRQVALLLKKNNKAIGEKSARTFYKWRVKFPYKIFIKQEKLP